MLTIEDKVLLHYYNVIQPKYKGKNFYIALPHVIMQIVEAYLKEHNDREKNQTQCNTVQKV